VDHFRLQLNRRMRKTLLRVHHRSVGIHQSANRDQELIGTSIALEELRDLGYSTVEPPPGPCQDRYACRFARHEDPHPNDRSLQVGSEPPSGEHV
jgi:hypothetical protein